MDAHLIALLEQELHPQADPHEGFSQADVVKQRLDPAAFSQVVHGVAEGTHTGEDDGGGAAQLLRLRDDPRLVADRLEGLLHAAQVAHAVVDDGDHRVPLVEGTPLRPSSRAAAIRRASPSPLKMASAM